MAFQRGIVPPQKNERSWFVHQRFWAKTLSASRKGISTKQGSRRICTNLKSTLKNYTLPHGEKYEPILGKGEYS